MSKTLFTAALILALSTSLAHGESRYHRGQNQDAASNSTASMQRSAQRGQEQQVAGTQTRSFRGNGGTSDQQVSGNRGQGMLARQQQKMQVKINNHTQINQAGAVGSSVVMGNNNTVNSTSSQMLGNTFQNTRNESGSMMSRGNHGDRSRFTAQSRLGGQQVASEGQVRMMQSGIRNEIGQTGSISSTITGGNMNTAHSASIAMSGVQQRQEMMQPSAMQAQSAMQEGRHSRGQRDAAIGQMATPSERGGMMQSSIRNEVRQTGNISSTITGGDNNIANAASLSMTGTRNVQEVRNTISGTGDIVSRISSGSNNRANAASLTLGETSVGGRVVNDVRNTGAISSTIEAGSNNQANAASISIN